VALGAPVASTLATRRSYSGRSANVYLRGR